MSDRHPSGKGIIGFVIHEVPDDYYLQSSSRFGLFWNTDFNEATVYGFKEIDLVLKEVYKHYHPSSIALLPIEADV